MRIEVNNNKVLEITDKCLTIENGRLFNTITKQYEGVDGDRVTFYITTGPTSKCWISGTVDGYTCHRRVKVRGHSEYYTVAEDCVKTIQPLSSIICKSYNEDDDWDLILKG